MAGRTHACGILDVLPDGGFPGEVGGLEEVVQDHLPDHVVAGEAVEVEDAEMQLAVGQLLVGHWEVEILVEGGVQGFAVHPGLQLALAVGQEVDLDVRVGAASCQQGEPTVTTMPGALCYPSERENHGRCFTIVFQSSRNAKTMQDYRKQILFS